MATAIEALLEACERRSGEVGILTLRDQVNKNQALFYLNNGGVYAIEVDSYDPPVKTRLMRTGRVDMEQDLDSAISSVGGEKTLQLPALIVQRQIADEHDVALITKDFFLEAASEALSWESVKVSWRKGFVYNEYPIPPLEGGKLVEIVASRSIKFQQVAETFQATPERVFEDVSVLASSTYTDSLNKPEEEAIYLTTKDTHQKIGDLMVGLGLTRVSVMKYVYSLWHANAVDVYINGINIRPQEEDTEDELTLDFMQPSAPSSDSASTPSQGIPVAPITPVVDEPIDSFSPSSAIPVNPELRLDNTPTYDDSSTDYAEEPQEEIPFNITSLEDEEEEEESFIESSSRYSKYDEEEIVELDFGDSQGAGQYAAPENEDISLSTSEEETEGNFELSTENYTEVPYVGEVSLDSSEVSVQEEVTEITQQADEKVEEMQESVTEAQESTTDEKGNELLTEMQSMLAKINSAVGESTQTLAVLAQQVEENNANISKLRAEREDLEGKIAELTQGLQRVVEEESKLKEQSQALDEQYRAEKSKMDEFTRGLDSLRSMFNG